MSDTGSAPHADSAPDTGSASPDTGSALPRCQQAVQQMWDYLDGVAVDQAGVEAHLAHCRRCCGELEFVSHLRHVLASQVVDENPPDVTRRLEAFVEELDR